MTGTADVRPVEEPLIGPAKYVYLLTFDPSGRTLAAATTDADLWLWDMTTGSRSAPLATINAPAGALYTVNFHPGGHVVAARGVTKVTWLFTTDPAIAAAQICAETGVLHTAEEWQRYIPNRRYQQPCGR